MPAGLVLEMLNCKSMFMHFGVLTVHESHFMELDSLSRCSGNDVTLKEGGAIMSNQGKENIMGMMSKMMQGDKPGMMMEMMTKCLGTMLQSMQKNDRIAFTLKIVRDLVQRTCVGMSDEEKEDFIAKLVENIKA